jgi:hypothetical protein
MQVQIRARNFRIPDTVCEDMERRICFALSRFVPRISLVTYRRRMTRQGEIESESG